MEWKDKVGSFRQIDVRGIQGNFFPGLKKQAMQLPAGSGLEIVQSFDPIPLYEVMEGLGFEHFTEQKGEAEFHAYFYRTEVKQEEPRQMFTNKDDSLAKQPKTRSEEKVGRNDPCPCGSGKKYKQCCGKPSNTDAQ